MVADDWDFVTVVILVEVALALSLNICQDDETSITLFIHETHDKRQESESSLAWTDTDGAGVMSDGAGIVPIRPNKISYVKYL